jgi:hypothetical protein
MNDVLVKYVRYFDHTPYGVVVTNGKQYGFSLCNPEDRFVKKEGMEKALKNLQDVSALKLSLLKKMKTQIGPVLHAKLRSIYKTILMMEDRCFRYFEVGAELHAFKEKMEEETKLAREKNRDDRLLALKAKEAALTDEKKAKKDAWLSAHPEKDN